MPPGVTYDAGTDILTVDGVRFSLGAFRDMASPLFNRWMKIIGRKDGVVTITSVGDPYTKLFDDIMKTENTPK